MQVESLLAGLARNPGVPEDLLVRLAHHQRAAQQMVCRRETLSDQVAAVILAHRDPRMLIHLHPGRVSPVVMDQIRAHPDPDVRDARRNQAMAWIDTGAGLPVDVLEQLLDTDRTLLALDPNPNVRVAVADAWWDPPQQARHALLTDPDPRVRAAAARRPHPPVPAVLQPALLADPATRAYVARSAVVTEVEALALAMDPDPAVREAAAGNPHLPAAALRPLLADPRPDVRAIAILHREIDDATRRQVHADLVAAATGGDIDAEMALMFSDHLVPDWVADVPVVQRLAYLDSPLIAFRRALAATAEIPGEAWARLDADPVLLVRRTAAARRDAPSQVIAQLLWDHGESPKSGRHVLRDHPNRPRDLYRRMANDSDPHRRRRALDDPDLPEHLVAALARDPDVGVRRSAATHPRLDTDSLMFLTADDASDVAEAAAAHPGVPAGWMRQVLDTAQL